MKLSGISELNDKVTFVFNNGTMFTGTIRAPFGADYHVSMDKCFNSYIFDLLGIDDPNAFVSKVVGYNCRNGAWPEVKTKHDLFKVFRALSRINSKEPELKVKESPIVIKPIKRKIKLNFNL